MADIKYSKQAQKFLAKQSVKIQKYIIDAIEAIPKGDIKKLAGREGYRLRLGSYRVIFDMFGNVIYIERIGNRGDVYKKGGKK